MLPLAHTSVAGAEHDVLPSTTRPAPDVCVGRSESGCAEGEDSFAVGAWLPLLKHSVTSDADILARYHQAESKRVFHAQMWRVFCSGRPMTAVFTLPWARTLSFLIGLWVVLRPPEGLIQMSWVQGPNSIAQQVHREARMLRFRSFEIRGGHVAPVSHRLASFGVLEQGCKRSDTLFPDADSPEAIISFPEVVSFDGWFVVTGSRSHNLDPTMYVLDASLDGKVWERVASSWNDCGSCKTDHELEFSEDDVYRNRNRRQIALPQERGAELQFWFTRTRCLWPYYILIVAHIAQGLSLMFAALIAFWSPNLRDPIKVIAACAILESILSLSALIGITTEDGPGLPYGPIVYTRLSLGAQCVMNILLFPGPALFTEARIIEQALLWGILQCIFQFINGGYSTVGPIHILVSVLLLVFRERRRYTVKQAVLDDMRAFNATWETICTEPQALQAMAWLAKVEQDIAEDAPLQLQQQTTIPNFKQRAADGNDEPVPIDTADDFGKPLGFLLESRAPLFFSLVKQNLERGPTPTLSIDQLYAQAIALEPIFRAKVTEIAGACEGHFFVSAVDAVGAADEGGGSGVQDGNNAHRVEEDASPSYARWESLSTRNTVVADSCSNIDQSHCRLVSCSQIRKDPKAIARVQWAGIKDVTRASHKITMDYEGRVSKLLDIVRQRIVFKSLHDLSACVEVICNDPDLEILRLRNRFHRSYDGETTAGYRDVVLVLRLHTEATMVLGLSGHLVELQLAHEKMVSLLNPVQHARYLHYRTVRKSFATFPPRQKLARVGSYSKKDRTRRQISHDLAGVLQHGMGSKYAGTLQQEGSAIVAPEPLPASLCAVDEDKSAMQASMMQRVFEVVRWRCSFDGAILKARSEQNNNEMQQADAAMLLFARPLWAVSKGPVKLALLLAAAYYSYLISIDKLYFNAVMYEVEVRHLRLKVLETRNPAVLESGGSIALGALDLMHNNYKHGNVSNGVLQQKGSDFFLSFPEPTLGNGWVLTTSLVKESEDADPIRFVVSASNPVTLRDNSLAGCLEANGWRTKAEAQSLSNAQQRRLVEDHLLKRGTRWCRTLNGNQSTDIGRWESAQTSDGGCLSKSGRRMTDLELVIACMPPWHVPEEEWEVISASSCRFGVQLLRCVPRPEDRAEIALDRGMTYEFDLRLRWYYMAGIFLIYFPIIIGCIFTTIFGTLGWLAVSVYPMASVFGLPGILEIITAFGLALDPDPLVNSMDSVYWWFLGITSVWVGWTMLCQQHKLMQMAPWPFLICLPILNLHYYFILRVEGPKVPYGHSMLLGFWFVFSALRQYHLHRSFQEMHEELDKYEIEWKSLVANPQDSKALEQLDLYCTNNLPSHNKRPHQIKYEVMGGGCEGVDKSSRSVSQGNSMGRLESTGDLGGSCELPFDVKRLNNWLWDTCLLDNVLIRSICGSWPERIAGMRRRIQQKIDNLDTLYMQAIVLEPVFLQKVHSLSQLTEHSSGGNPDVASHTSQRDAEPGIAPVDSLVPVDEVAGVGGVSTMQRQIWEVDTETSLLKSVDRTVEKLSRVYKSEVWMLLDVVRSCIVVDTIEEMNHVVKLIVEDQELRVLRVQNRMSMDYDARNSCGYRDILVNLCIHTPFTCQLGLCNHVCELQIILKSFMILKTQDGHKRYVMFRNKRCA